MAYDNRFVPNNPFISYASFCAAGLAGNTYCFSPDTYNKNWGTNLTLDWKINPDLALKSISAYRSVDTQWTEDNDVSPMYGSLGAEHLLNHTLTEELRLNGKVASILDYSGGGFYLDQVTTYPTHQVLDCVIPGLDFEFLGNDPVQETDYAAFANATWHIVEGLNLNGGVRYTHQEKECTCIRYNPSQVQPYGPEDLTAYEIGAKSDWFDHSLRVNVAGFYNKYKAIQLVLLTCPHIPGAARPSPVPRRSTAAMRISMVRNGSPAIG